MNDLIEQLLEEYNFSIVVKYHNKKEFKEDFFKDKAKEIIEWAIENVELDKNGYGYSSIYQNGFICTVYMKEFRVDRILLDYSISSTTMNYENTIKMEYTDKMLLN